VSGARWTGSDQSRRTAAAARTLRGTVRFAGRAVLRTQTDQRLVELAQCGSEPAFETIVERYRGPLRRYCRRFVPSSRVDDVLQQAFFDAYRAIHQKGRTMKLRPWLFRVTHNVAIDTVRQESRGWNELSERPQGIGRADPAVDNRESLRDLLSTLQGLPEQQRAALVLREMEGRSYEEISEELGVSESAVGQLLARARHGLQNGASAVLPFPLLVRIPGGASGAITGERVTELVSAAGGAAGVAKAVTMLVVAGAAGGAILAPGGEEPSKARDRSGQELAPSTEPASLEEAPVRSGRERTDGDHARAGRDRAKQDRPGRGRTGDQPPGAQDVTRDSGPSPDPEPRSDEDEMERGEPLGDGDGADPDDGNPDPAPPSRSPPENHAQDLDTDTDVEPVPDVESGAEIGPDLDPPTDAP
jgi:RNA polymerase sigma factor (sigma-70 family)